MSDTEQAVARLAERQGGHVTRAQLFAAGVPRGAVEARLQRGRLIQVFYGVYAVGRLATAPQDRAWAALLAAGDGAALCGHSAAHLLGVLRDWREPAAVLLRSRKPRTRAGLSVRYSGTLAGRDIWNLQGLPVTSPARTALDMVTRLDQKRRVRMINELRMEHRLTLEQLADVVTRNADHRGATVPAELTGVAQRQPTRSQLEDAFLSMLVRHGLPAPVMNEMVAGYRVDALFPDHGLVVELDGFATRGSKQAFEEDRRRVTNVLAATGMPTLRFTYDQTTAGHRETAAQLRAVLQRLAAQAS